MNQGYLLADGNSLAYAYRTGGTKLLDIYYDLASKEHRLLAITETVRKELKPGPRGSELLKYIADKHIPIIPAPETERSLRAGAASKNAGEHSMTEVAAREHAQGRSTAVWSDDKFFASAQELQKAPGIRPTNSAEMLDHAFQKGAIAHDVAGEVQYRKYIEAYRALPAIRSSTRLNAFEPPAPGLRVRAAEASAADVAAFGGRAVVAGAVAVETYTAGRQALRLLDQGNVTGAQSEILHFGARNLGMAGAAALGARAGAAFGGVPGLVIGGAVNGVAGAVVGDKLLDAADQARIYHQRGSDGNAWHLDERPGHGWMRMSTDEGPGRGGMPMRPVYADARLADELNYKASSRAVDLALARPPAPQDPYSHTPETIGEQVRAGIGAGQPWTRDPQSHAWTRQATEAATPMTHGMPVQRTLSASPEQTLQLEAAARRTMADNIAHSPQAMAQRYLEAYAQHGWKQHGPVPAAVVDAAPGHAREERDAPRQQTPAQPQPASGHLTPQQIERITTHESRIVPTPGGMSFAEAHRRRDEPEQISPGSLRPVGKLDISNLDKSSPLYRMHLAQEQALMRDLEIALAQDRERFKNEPSPQRTQQPSVERTQERALERVQAPASSRGEHVPNRQGAAEERAATPPPSQPMAQPAAAAIAAAQAEAAAAQARAAAAQAELAAMREQMARMAEQRRPDGLERRDERDPISATAATAVADTSRPLLRDFGDPSHPQHALYSTLKAGLPARTDPAWLSHITAACYKIGIKQPDDLGDVVGREGKLHIRASSLVSRITTIDVTQPTPSVQQTMQDVQQFDQQRAHDRAQAQAQAQAAAQANQQQGPVMG
jgi:hypothetical protein